MKMKDFSSLKLTNKSDEELVDIAQTFADEFSSVRNQLKEFSSCCHLNFDEKENQILNKIFATLKEKRSEQLSSISSKIPEIIKQLVSSMDLTNMNETLQKINTINQLNEEGKYFELVNILNELKIHNASSQKSTYRNQNFSSCTTSTYNGGTNNTSGNGSKSNHKLGQFKSWYIQSEDIIIKMCDKSVFDHHGSGISMDTLWFWGAEGLSYPNKIELSLLFEGKKYDAQLTTVRSHNQVRIFWGKDLSYVINNRFSKNDPPQMQFRRIGDNTYELTFAL